MLPAWLSLHPSKGVYLILHIQPGAKKTEIVGEYGGALKIKVQAPPVEGAANEALFTFLAKKLRIRKNQLELVQGGHARAKRVCIQGLTGEEIFSLLERGVPEGERLR